MLVAAVGQMRVMHLPEFHQVKAVGTAAAQVHIKALLELAAVVVAQQIFEFVRMHQFQIYVH
jgi:hypothetical protein